MTDYNALAQRIVALGVGEIAGEDLYQVPEAFGVLCLVPAKAFCNDGRVVLALMEKVCEWGGFNRICPNTTEDFLCTAYRGYGHRRNTENAVSESLAAAICEACCEALENATTD